MSVFSIQALDGLDPFGTISQALGPVWTIVVVASTAGGVILLIAWFYELRPRHESPKTSFSYIDFAYNEAVEEKEFVLHWGHWIRHRIKLPPVPRTATCRMFYHPDISYKKEMPMSCYEQSDKGGFHYVVLTDKTHFKAYHVDRIYVQTLMPQTDESYKDKIQLVPISTGITVNNLNVVEVRNYPVKLPKEMGLDKVQGLLGSIANLIVPAESTNAGGANDGITIAIKRIDPAEGRKPGTVFIPIPSQA